MFDKLLCRECTQPMKRSESSPYGNRRVEFVCNCGHEIAFEQSPQLQQQKQQQQQSGMTSDDAAAPPDIQQSTRWVGNKA